MERQLVAYEKILDLQPIPDADRIEVATVRGWQVVVRKGEFEVGDKVVYFEIDSALPLDDERFAFLEPQGVKVLDGKNYHVLRTARLRGQFSQGLVLPAEQFSDGLPEIEKYEKPLPIGEETIVSHYPVDWAPKTDAIRIQDFYDKMDKINALDWIATEKIDGTSTTFINDGLVLRIATRNFELEVTPTLLRYKVATEMGIMDLLPEGYALQGELFGPGIQGNPLNMKKVSFKAFNLYKKGELIPYDEWPEDLVEIRVPVLDMTLPDTVLSILEQVDGMKSVISPDRRAEGIVWHCGAPQQFLGMRDGFKAISNTYLTKLKD